jgi:hypothetical protein
LSEKQLSYIGPAVHLGAMKNAILSGLAIPEGYAISGRKRRNSAGSGPKSIPHYPAFRVRVGTLDVPMAGLA